MHMRPAYLLDPPIDALSRERRNHGQYAAQRHHSGRQREPAQRVGREHEQGIHGGQGGGTYPRG
jgi:hypothetical protein